jgi:nitroreductase
MSQATTPDSALQQLKWRYATKQFDPSKTIADDVWHVLEQSMVLAPSSFGLQPWKFIVVRNPEVRQELLANSWKQAQVVDASHYVVFAIKKNITEADVDRYINHQAATHGVEAESLAGFGGMIKGFLKSFPTPDDIDHWSKRQLYIALGEFMTTAAMLGVDTCALEGISPAKYDEILGLSAQGYGAVVGCAVGYRKDDDKYATKPKVRYATSDVVQYVD